MASLHYERIQIVENKDPMVDLSAYPFLSDPIYYRQGLSNIPKSYMRKTVAEKLVQLQNGPLAGYQFKIWDSWRSRAVQRNVYEKLWNELKSTYPDWGEEKLRREVAVFVSAPDRPDRIPPHSTGGAVDLTLVEKNSARELNMGTRFDHFGFEAKPDYFEHSDENLPARNNRRLLQSAMSSAGFTQDPDEWWHFDYGNQKWAEVAGKGEAFYGEVVDVNAFLSK